MLWSEVKQLWEEGFTKYVYQWWNWLDFIMICLYLCTISLRFFLMFMNLFLIFRASAYLIYVFYNNEYTPQHVIRTHWDAYEPMVILNKQKIIENLVGSGSLICSWKCV